MTTTPPLFETPKQPTVVKWFKVYCGVLCFLYLCVAALSLVFFLVSPKELDMSELGACIMAFFLLGSGLVLFGVCLAPFVVTPRPWVWGYGMGLICLGMTSACFVPVCVPLLIFWLKPEAKKYFGQ
ncbi:MAG: hypothetical protein WC740_14615 [Verrucomicrobiia bacterium]